MAPNKEFTLNEGLSLNVTCRIRKGPRNPITWQKDGKRLDPYQIQSPKIMETK